jgi:Flp pilus assembly protein TadD
MNYKGDDKMWGNTLMELVVPRRRHQKKSDRTDFPVSSPQPVSNVSRQDFDSLLDQVQGLLEKQKYEDALALIDAAPPRFKLRPELMLVQALALMNEGEYIQSEALLNEIEKKHPKYYPLYYHQGLIYMTLLWPAHALRAVRKIPRWYLEDDEMRSDLEELTAAASTLIESLADELTLSPDKAEKATYSNERAQALNLKGEYTAGEQSAREAVRLAPNWTSPRNNRAYALYFSGRCAEAIEAAEETLTLDSKNLHALNHLATFHAGLGNEQVALGYARRTLSALKNGFQETDAWEIVIAGLSLVEDDESLYKLTKEKKLPVEELSETSLYALGVAAYRTGDQRMARRLWQSAEKTGYEPAKAALASLKQDPLWPPTYLAYSLLWPEALLDRWIAILDGIEADEPTRSQQKEIDAYIQRYPFVLEVMKRMLWEETAHKAALTMLEYARHPAGYAGLLRFATSDRGPDQDRMEAFFVLERAGQIESGEQVKFWNAEKQEWTEVSIYGQRIEDPEYNIAPEVADLINRARDEDLPGAIELLEAAVRLDPDCAIAIHNLGINYINQGEEEKGRTLVRRSVEVDPGYLFGYASLAGLEAQDENYEKAIEYLDKITRAEVVPTLAAIQAQHVWIDIAIGQKEYGRARKYLGLLKNLDPENDYSDLDARLSLLETFSGLPAFFSNWQRDYAHKTHKKLLKSPIQPTSDLTACLGRITRESLVGTCRLWQVSTAGKKAELIARLSQAILNESALKMRLLELETEERKALRWILEAGGWRSWQGFIEMFGDDMDESPSWEHHEPETVPGRLKRMGLLTAGTCEGEHVAFIASDLRPLLRKLLPEAD